ncbi:hypothetical protein L3Q82_019628 [Scortum barcoo]|uniref:Uncharacterized protein n=1 Tax=Scortum barcoo TaxID=214431 RepID=A0ACB8VC07_9TELE|nr:hypothetical protein L3Q82_019628 [Scortum barcoo]
MDPADPGAITKALSAQGIIVGKHDSQIQEMVDTLRDLSNSMARMQTQLSLLTPGSAGSEGTPPGLSSSLAAGSTVSTPREPFVPTPESYAAEMKKVFDHPVQGQEAVKRLLDLRQGSQSVAAYSVDFRILAAASVISSPSYPLVLGLPWLKAHSPNPNIDWSTCTITSWSPFCLANCLHSASPSPPPLEPTISEVPDLSSVPSVYHDLAPVFSKAKATSLPPHRPYDCPIDLLPDPPSSPLGAGFFFVVEKKDKTLRLCIDFRGLNDITIKNKYPLPLIDPACLEPFHQATIFSKLDLRNAYHLVRIREGDEWKTAFNTPLGHFEYQFIVEVDASETGIGAVLSQRCPVDQKVHPCAFFSRRLTPAERNYDVGNRELLAVVLALQEWRHWLEGAEQPFLVWTDHKNLAYLRSAKRLNPRQARWALFLSRFEFTLTYRPGSHNTKPDALSRQFSLDTSPSEPASILPPSCIVGAASWDIETRVQEALKDHPAPNNCPKDRLFVPSNLRSLVLQWIHTSKFSCHPGIRRTLFLLQQRFWWPRMAQDTQEYINACSVCARSSNPFPFLTGKSSHRAPAGFLKPLPIPPPLVSYCCGRPWSHHPKVAVDFVSGLPPSQALETASLLTDHVFRLHGLPTDIVSDRGPQFTSQVWTAFCKALGATPSLSSGYHPQSNGQTERANQSLETALRCSALLLVTRPPGARS